MGCKQCKIFLTKHERNPNQISIQLPVISKSRSRTFPSKTFDYPSMLTLDHLPVELIYHILDRLDTHTIFISLNNVSKQLNWILRSYDQYKLNLKSIPLPYFHRLCSFIRPEQIVSLTLSDGKETVGLVKLFLHKFPIESFRRLQSLTLINIDDNEQMIRIFLSIPDQLQILSIENSTEIYDDAVMDILMTMIEKTSLEKLTLDIERTRILNPSMIWPMRCFLNEIKFVGLCHISLFRHILLSASNLRKFQAFDIDFDDEWIDEDGEEVDQGQLLPIINASNLTSLSLTYARNEMEKIEWLLPQLTQLNSFKYLNIYDFHIESIYESDYSLLDGERWEKLLGDCDRFEFIFTNHIDDEDDEDESWNVLHYLSTFQTRFWREKNWNIVLEQYEKVLLMYSLPYAHNSHYYDRPTFFSIPYNPCLLNNSMNNVTKLRINLSAVNRLGVQIIGPPRFSHVSHLILDGTWRDAELTDAIASLVSLSNVTKLIRFERVPTLIFRDFLSHLSKLKSLTLTTLVLDGLNAAVFQYQPYLYSLTIVQFDDHYRHYVNIEPFCTMFSLIEHLDIPIDNLDSCQYVIDRLQTSLISVIFRFPADEDEDDEDEDNEKHRDLIEWAESLQSNHQYRIRDGDIYLWLE